MAAALHPAGAEYVYNNILVLGMQEEQNCQCGWSVNRDVAFIDRCKFLQRNYYCNTIIHSYVSYSGCKYCTQVDVYT